LTPKDVTPSSGKKVWWKCPNDHEWQASISHRSSGRGCPYCAGKAVCDDNCLQTINPTLAREWHPTKNGKLTPRDVTPSSNRKVWWICDKGHEWEATIYSRSRGARCPYCSGKLATGDNCLQTVNLVLAREWHPVRNGKLTPRDVTPSSGEKVWWRCDKGHEWEATINDRSRGTGCPYCSGKLATSDNCLQRVNPVLAKEWHPTKNGSLTPRDVTPSSHKKVWWRCDKGHEWEAVITNRSLGRGCPYCAGQAVCEDNCLQTINPTLAKEWHPLKNGKLTPRDVTPNSGKKAWWICGKGHEWEAVVGHRNNGTGCPYCAGKAVCEDNCLQTINPTLAREWHPTGNGTLTPRDVTPSSNKKVWWICDKGHEWEATINDRSRGTGCPYCSGKLATSDNCLQRVNPVLAKEWHPTKNGSLTPRDVTPSSHKKVWWRCDKGHEWEAVITNRSLGRGCPYCAGQAVCEDNCLQTINPTLAKEWHPLKNGKLTPRDVTPNSGKKAWWICGKGHEWEAVVSHRNNGTGCPYCHSATSQLELRILCEMKYLFKDVHHREKVYGEECDIFIPALRVGIEVDGLYWHRNKSEHDKRKSAALENKGIRLIRVREEGLERISDTDVFFPSRDSGLSIVRRIVEKITEEASLSESSRNSIGAYLERKRVANDSEYKQLLEMLPSPLPGFSLQEQNPNLAREWHQARNGSLTPRDVTPSSHQKAWWICGKGHEWEATIANRSKGKGCPYCAGRAVCDDNCLQTINPTLAREWHLVKNGTLTPRDVTPSSNKKVWWRCDKGHEWEAIINSRSGGTGCPYCAGKAVCDDNCLQTINPTLAKEWHPVRNGKLTPRDITPGSNKKVWWICDKGHEWESVIASRSQGSGCPYCAGQAVCDDNCLQTINPTLAREWHLVKNGKLTPRDVTPNSGKKVWWICGKGHEWEAVIANRSKGRGCPYCAGKAASGEDKTSQYG
jgi:hypothetical protein